MLEEIELKKAHQQVAAAIEVTRSMLEQQQNKKKQKKQEQIEEDPTPMIFEESKEVDSKILKKALTPTDDEGDK